MEQKKSRLKRNNKKYKLSKHKIFESKKYLCAVLDSVVDGIVTINALGVIENINPAGESLFGYLPGELVGLNVSSLIPITQLFIHDKDMEGPFEERIYLKEEISHEIKGVRKDGNILTLDLSVSEVNLNGEGFFVALLKDKTSSQRLEIEARRSAKIKSMITDACLDAMVTVDMDGYVQEYNTAAVQIFGWKREEIIGQLMENYFIPEDMRAHHHQGMARFKKNGSGPLIGERIEIEAVRKSGERFPVELALVATEIDGERLATAFIRDISKQKRAKKELIAARDAAEDASQAKSRFLSHMSHEIRSPLNAVLCSVNLVAERVKNPEHLRLLHTAKTSGQALLTVINEVLDFSKIEAGHLSIIYDQANLRTLIEDVLNSAQARIEKPELDLLCSVDPIVNQVITDPIRLRQIVNVLVDNAIKFTEKGVVSVMVKKASLEARPAIKVSVYDTGVGIPTEYLHTVFNEFEQVDATRDSRYGGTGLGLTIARRLVELLEGNINVESMPERGSCFTFTIPVGINSFQNDSPPLSFGSIMLVSPNVQFRDALARQAKQVNCIYESFPSLEALKMVQIDKNIKNNNILLVDEKTPGVVCENHQAVLDFTWLLECPYRVLCLCSDWADLNEPFSNFCRISKPLSFNFLCQLVNSGNDEINLTTQTPQISYSGRLLLVEDVAANRLVAGEMLRSRGFEVSTACNGLEALKIASQEFFDAILMDIRMPKMNGYDAVEALRKGQGINAKTPVIALTANAERTEIKKCLKLGMNDFVSKPFVVEHLLEAIKRSREQNFNPSLKEPAGLKLISENQNELLRDQTVLEQLVRDTSQASLIPLLTLFLKELDTRFDAIQLAAGAGNVDAVREEAHALKSCSGTFGALQLQELATSLEYAARDEDISLVDILTTKLDLVSLETQKNYQDYLNTVKNC